MPLLPSQAVAAVALPLALTVGALTAAGCQNTDGLFQKSSGVGGASTTAVVGTGATGTSSTASSTGTHGSSSTGSHNATTGVGPGGTSGATTTAAATTAAATTSVTTGSGGGSTWCNGQPCATGDVCCYSNTIMGQDKCSAPNTCLPGFVQLSCNGPADCPGGECCGKWSNTFGWQAMTCQTSCTSNERVMCYGDASVCQGGQQCVPSSALGDGYAYCGNGGG